MPKTPRPRAQAPAHAKSHFLSVLLMIPIIVAAEPLHPTGNFDALPVWPKGTPAKMTEMVVHPPTDASERRQQFARRNSPKEIEALCLRLHAAMEPNAPHLDSFRALVAKKAYTRALDAYRTYFFAKIRNPEGYGASTKNLTGYQLKATKAWVLQRIDPKFVELAMQGVYTHGGLRGTVGMPGAMSWVPHTLKLPQGATYGRSGNSHPFWATEEGRAVRGRIEFFRALNKFPLDHMPLTTRLLQSYTLTGNPTHLKRSCEILDDWTLNARKDIDMSPLDIRSATELESERLRDFPGMMRVMVDERPELAEGFDSATLARLVLHALNDFIPYTIRAKRTELANWGIMGIGNAFHLATLFQEFKGMTYARRELWRLWNINFTHYFALDGAAYEAPDTGHSRIAVPRARECMPYCLLPDVAGSLERQAFDDLLRDRMRYVVVEMSPRARQHPRFDPKYSTHPTYEWLEAKWTTFGGKSPMKDLLWEQDAEVRNRMNTAMRNMGKSEEKGVPSVRSDVAPYAAMYFLRDSWDADAEHFRLSDYQGSSVALALRHVAHKSVVFGRENGRFDLEKNGCHLVVGTGIVADRKPGNFFHGRPKTGGKTVYCAQPSRTVVGNRFHSSDHFDLAESVQANPYYRPPEGVRKDSHLFNLYNVVPGLDNTPVKDVKTHRRAFALRGQSVYFVNTRIENSGATEHEYSQFFAMPVWVPAKNIDEATAQVKELREAGHALHIEDVETGFWATSNINRENVSIYMATNESLQPGNIIDNKGNHASLPPQLDVMEAALVKYRSRNISGRDFGKLWPAHQLRPVSVRWRGTGNQVFQTVIVARDASEDEAKTPLSGGLRAYETTRGENGVLGCSLTTRSGTPAWFQAGPEARNKLQAGPVTTTAEVVMAARKDGTVRGMVIGAETLRINGKAYSLAASDAEFALTANGEFTSTPIHRPIDTVNIHPRQTVFVDTVGVSFDITTQDTADIEFRYTLDGSDPTLESALYSGPFALGRTARVKVRPFRKGLARTPWNFPGIDAGKTISCIFTKVDQLPSMTVGALEPGLRYEYLEGDWPSLFMSGETMPANATGKASSLLAPDEVQGIRKTDGAYAIRYEGYIDVPRDGVYVWHAPQHLLDVTMDAGFDLRLQIDGKDWFPEPGLHAQNTWSVALKKGHHRLKVLFVDYRYKTFKSEYWLPWQEVRLHPPATAEPGNGGSWPVVT